MDEVEYVVPPGAHSNKSTHVPDNNLNTVVAPGKPKNFLQWIKTHKVLIITTLVIVGILVATGSVIFTGKKVALLGLQLNPLYNKADNKADCSETNPNSDSNVNACGETPVLQGSSALHEDPLSIQGSFADGIANSPYTQNLTVSGTVKGICTWSVVSTTPNIEGATFFTQDGPGKNSTFRATAATAGIYEVAVRVNCDTQEVSKSFNWIVNPAVNCNIDTPCPQPTEEDIPPSSESGPNICKTFKSSLIPIYRFWDQVSGDHLYTTNANEKPAGYANEGVSAYVFKTKIPDSIPIYRSYQASLTSHYYSTTNDAANYGYKSQGILGYGLNSGVNGSLPWYRMHFGAPVNDYLETISTKEKTELIANGYQEDGIVANVCGVQ